MTKFDMISSCRIGRLLCGLFALWALLANYCDAETQRFNDSLDEAARELILKLHNDARAAEGAAYMNELRWSSALEAKAIAWLNRMARDCPVLKHPYNPARLAPIAIFGNTRFPMNPMAGQNLAMYGSYIPITAEPKDILAKGFAQWIGEKKKFTYGKGIDKSKKALDSWGQNIRSVKHYTQVVWDSTNEMGCAIKRCAYRLEDFQDAFAALIGCHYYPAGNRPRNSQVNNVVRGNNEAFPFKKASSPACECEVKGSGISINSPNLCVPACYGWASEEVYGVDICSQVAGCTNQHATSQWRCGCTITCGKYNETDPDRRYCKEGGESPYRGSDHECPAQ